MVVISYSNHSNVHSKYVLVMKVELGHMNACLVHFSYECYLSSNPRVALQLSNKSTLLPGCEVFCVHELVIREHEIVFLCDTSRAP